MNKKEKAAVVELLRCCQFVVRTKEYQRIRIMLADANSKVGDIGGVRSLKSAFEKAAIAVAEMIGCGPSNDDAGAQP